MKRLLHLQERKFQTPACNKLNRSPSDAVRDTTVNKVGTNGDQAKKYDENYSCLIEYLLIRRPNVTISEITQKFFRKL